MQSTSFSPKKFLLNLLLDGIGLLSFTIPGIGEFSDVIWAPLSAYLLMKMYPGTIGKISGTISFLEEILPGSDFIPTFTLTYLYETFIKKNENAIEK